MLLINPIIINRYRKKIHLPLKASLMIFIDKEKGIISSFQSCL